MNTKEVVSRLKELGENAKTEYKEGMARFGIKSDTALGVPLPAIRALAKEIGKNHELALELWEQPIHEAKIIATMIDDPKLVTEVHMDKWTHDFYSWDICDQCCGNLFDKTPFCQKKIREYVKSDEEFVRRTGFVLMATTAVHDKKAPNIQFLEYLRPIKEYSTDKRNFVKKAVNWALRQIGKRNMELHAHALQVAKELKNSDDKTARWIGSDAARELEKKTTIERIMRSKQKK